MRAQFRPAGMRTIHLDGRWNVPEFSPISGKSFSLTQSAMSRAFTVPLMKTTPRERAPEDSIPATRSERVNLGRRRQPLVRPMEADSWLEPFGASDLTPHLKDIP